MGFDGMNEILIRIVAPHFVAGIICRNRLVAIVPPILKYMSGWLMVKVIAYCKEKGWSFQYLMMEENYGSQTWKK